MIFIVELPGPLAGRAVSRRAPSYQTRPDHAKPRLLRLVGPRPTKPNLAFTSPAVPCHVQPYMAQSRLAPPRLPCRKAGNGEFPAFHPVTAFEQTPLSHHALSSQRLAPLLRETSIVRSVHRVAAR